MLVACEVIGRDCSDKDCLLFEIPFYNEEWLEKYSTIDKNRMFRMYSSSYDGSKETNADFYWDLKIVEHPDLIAWKEKYEKSNR